MDFHKNYQESKVKGTGIGIFPEWLSNISIFGVAGPGIAVAGAAAEAVVVVINKNITILKILYIAFKLEWSFR